MQYRKQFSVFNLDSRCLECVATNECTGYDYNKNDTQNTLHRINFNGLFEPNAQTIHISML